MTFRFVEAVFSDSTVSVITAESSPMVDPSDSPPDEPPEAFLASNAFTLA